jgi:tetratricopeptide (TPR) repeat protein
MALSRQFFARRWPVVRTAGERLLHLFLALLGAFARGMRATPPRLAAILRRIHFNRGHHEIASAPEPEATPEVDDAGRDDPSLRQALARLATREYAYGANHPDVASELHFIGALHHEGGRYDEALAYYGQALAIRERTLSSDHPELASTLEDLAATRQAQGESAEAEQLLTRARHLRVRYRSPLLDKTDLKPQFARENP